MKSAAIYARVSSEKQKEEGTIGSQIAALARIDHRFGNEGDFGRPERFSESFAIDPVQVE